MTNRAKKLITFATIISCTLASLWFAAFWFSWEPSGIKKDSLTYRFKVHEKIKDFPVWNAINEPLFDMRNADGEKKSATIFRYHSSLQLQPLKHKALENGFQCQKIDLSDVFCSQKISSGQLIQMILIQQQTSISVQVEVVFIGY